MADIDIGSIGGTLYLVDKGWSSTLGAAEKALGSVDKAVNNFSSRLSNARKIIDDYVDKAREVGTVSEKQIFAFESLGNALGVVSAAAGPVGAALKIAAVSVAAVGTAALATGAALYYAANKSADLGDELLTMSKKTDVSVESLSAWRYISNQVGVSLENVANSVSKFSGDLGKGSKSFKESIGAIGLSIDQLRNMKPDEAFQKTIDALGKVPNAADRAAVGVALFGQKFKDLKPLIGEDIGAMKKDFEDFGGTITKQMAVAADAFNDAKARLGAMFEAIVVQVGSVLHVPLTGVFNAIGDAWIETRKKMDVDSAKFVEFMDRTAVFFIEAIGGMIRAVGEITKVVSEFFAGSKIQDFKLLDIIAGIGQNFANLQMIIAKLQGDDASFKFAEGLAQTFRVTKDFAKGAVDGLEDLRAGINLAADTAINFGKALTEKAAGAVAAARAAVTGLKDETNGAFQGLGQQADKALERLEKWYNAYIKRVTDAAEKSAQKALDYAEKLNDRAMKVIGDGFKQMVDDQEEADRAMRKLTQSTTQFEIGEIKRRLDKRVELIKMDQTAGVSADLTAKRIAAAYNLAETQVANVVIKTKEYNEALVAVQAMLMAMGPLGAGAFASIAEEVENVANQVEETVKLTDILKDSFEGIGGDMVGAIFQGFKSGGLAGAIGGVAQTAGNALGGAITKAAVANMGSFWGNVAGMAYGQILGFMIDQAMKEFGQTDRLLQANKDARAMFSDILDQFGGSQRAMDEAMERAGVDRQLQSKIRGGSTAGEGTWSSPEELSKAWDEARISLTKYENGLKGLDTALQGVQKISIGVFKSFTESAEAQFKARSDAQEAIIKMMEKEEATEEEIAAKRAYFADLNKGAIFTATEEQIAQFNRLGTIAGGVIANIAGRTGDMVAAFQAASSTLDPMLEISRRFDMTGQINASTQEVLRFYGIIKDNADVFTAVQGVGQIFEGFGAAQINNLELVNALGHELEDSALKLQAAGVSVTDIYAMLSPQLQQLWEVVEDGKLTVDDTTRALLDQAEAQGVVGNDFRDINEQILMVLTEIRDMFQQDLPEAVRSFGDTTTQTGNAIRRSISAVGDETLGTGEKVRGLGDELENLGKIRVPPIKARVDFEMGDFPEFPDDWNYRGPRVEPAEFRTGSYGFQQFGDGTPAMLHGLERVQTYSDYMADRRNETSGVVIELDGEVLVAYNARHAGQWARVRAGRSTRTQG